MKIELNKKGSAIITASGMGIVLAMIIIAVFSFSSYRTQTVTKESKKVKALALAEAGLEVALGELYSNSSFVTHTLKFNSDKELEWDSKENNENRLSNNNVFTAPTNGTGTISGKLGDGEFKVRVGNIPWGDNPHTKTENESKSYLKIEAIGKFDNTFRKIIAIVNRRFPTREFLMYDKDVLSVVYGQNDDPQGVNVFSVGHLYGGKGVEISQILNSYHKPTKAGTRQKLFAVDSIISGEGGVFFYSPVEATFFNNKGNIAWNNTIQKNYSFPTNGTYPNGRESFGEFPAELQNITPTIPDDLKTWIKDSHDGIKLEPNISFEEYQNAAKNNGKHYTTSTAKYRVPNGWPNSSNGLLDVVYLDFGTNQNLRTPTIKKSDIPNGIIYSNKDIVLKGNPPRDVSIVSEKNIFIAGDFNQSGGSDYKYGFPQDYKDNKNAIIGDDYANKDLFEQDIDKKEDDESRYHVAATVIAKERLVFDHRSPVDCFENELYPFLKYELAKTINTGSSNPEDCLSPSSCSGLVIKASDTYDGFKESIASFTKKYNISDADNLANELVSESSYNNEFNNDALDEMTKKAWQAYVKDFDGGSEASIKGQLTSSSESLNQGIYQLLFRLRAKITGSEDNSDNPISELHEPAKYANYSDKQGDLLYYPEMTTNGMFVSCGKLNNEFYSGPDVVKYFNQIGQSGKTGKNDHFIKKWYENSEGFIHRLYGTETNLRMFDVGDISKVNYYKPPLRKKIYDETLARMGEYSKNKLELVSFVVMSWEDVISTKKEYDEF